MWPKRFPGWLLTKTDRILLTITTSKTVILFCSPWTSVKHSRAPCLTSSSGFIHYDSGFPCGPRSIIKFVNRDFLTSALCTSAAVVLFEGLFCEIPWALNCSNYGNCAKTRPWPRFDRRSLWIFIIPRFSLTITLLLGILTSLRIMVTLGQRLGQTVLAPCLHLKGVMSWPKVPLYRQR